MNIASIASAGASAGLVRAAESSPEVAAKLLKKTVEADRNLVNALLPAAGTGGQRLDIRA